MRSILKHKMKFSLKVGCPANGLPACCLSPERVGWLLAAFVVMLNFAPTFGLAQESGLRFSHFTTSDGLSDNYTTSVIQDRRGFIWIGTEYGLNRFDGRSFKRYEKLGEGGLTDLNIKTIAEDADGNIWIGTQNGLNRLNSRSDVITQYFMGDGPGTIPFRWCNYLYVDKRGILWLSTEKGIARYDKATNSFRNHAVEVCKKEGRVNKFISKIFEDSKGRFWLATSYGVKLFDYQKETFQTFLFPKPDREAPSYAVVSLSESADGVMYAGTWGDGLLRFDEQMKAFVFVDCSLTTMVRLVIADIMPMRMFQTDYLWLASSHGLIAFNPETQEKTEIALPDEVLTQLCRDRQQNIWITSTNGLYKLNANSLAFRWIGLPASHSRQLVYHIIPSVLDPENVFFLSTLGGWFEFDRLTNQLKTKSLPADPRSLLVAINRWVTDSSGYWFTSMNGMGYYNPSENRLTDLTHHLAARTPYKAAHHIVASPGNKLLISLYRSGLLQLDRGTGKSELLFADTTRPDHIFGTDFGDMLTAQGGEVFFTAGGRLYVLSGSAFAFKTVGLPEHQSRTDIQKTAPDQLCLAFDKDLFVSSKLQIFRYNVGRLKRVFPKEGYADFFIERMFFTPHGKFLFITSKGVFSTDTSFQNWFNIGNRLTWSDNELITDILPCNDGALIFGARGKIGIVNDTALQSSQLPPRVVISRIKYGDNEKFMLDDSLSRIHLSYRESIEIELSGVNYTNVKEVKLYYKLEGWKDAADEFQGNNPIIYQQLPPGRYTFKTWQQNAEGHKSPESVFRFVVHPPFYLTWWFILLNIAALLSAFYLFNRYEMRKALELERLRTRIASDLHDDIGATLSAVSLYAETLKRSVGDDSPHVKNVLTKIAEGSREMVASMSDIIWSVNPENDTLERLVRRMRNFATDMCQARDILLQFGSDEALLQLKLPLESRKNVFLIFKEAINNAVKYSGAKTISVQVRTDGKTIRMVVEDDGQGFDVARVTRGNGLKNIQRRAASIGGSEVITSEPGKGTKVDLQWKT